MAACYFLPPFSDYPFLKKLFAYGGYQGPDFQKALAKILPQPETEIVKRSDRMKGFAALPRCWLVERTFAWLTRCRRLAKDWENLNCNALAFLRLASLASCFENFVIPPDVFATDSEGMAILSLSGQDYSGQGGDSSGSSIKAQIFGMNDNAPVITTAASQSVAENHDVRCRADLDGCRHGWHQPSDILDHGRHRRGAVRHRRRQSGVQDRPELRNRPAQLSGRGFGL